ncbi:type II toxin-antitoxin system VapC family toxin [Oscillatoria sp. FACHB-1406]|uniref:PIN domain-containing protein n=1 Tax=Oscillatoria sp. FACHB-1406 TaxID=2692846 RepID=UPI001688FE4C|nr:type II toxin-antitoxin system VapC family toxin [Oscillatoria sp. FACHB-1406]MBD2578231.1 type II toxin-antitoxin system VapC family toxin [Oscillatoria sp. FACHB-1406]
MRGLDTNVIVRFLVRDDPTQWQIADCYINEALQVNEPCFINNIVLCEVAWVLRSRYKLGREQLIQTLESLLRANIFVFEEPSAIEWAIQQMRLGNADFSDYLIARVNQLAGCSETASFDAKLSHLPHINSLR